MSGLFFIVLGFWLLIFLVIIPLMALQNEREHNELKAHMEERRRQRAEKHRRP